LARAYLLVGLVRPARIRLLAGVQGSIPNGGTHEIDYDPAKPEEAAEAKRIFDDLMSGNTVTAEETEMLMKELEPSLRPAPVQPRDNPTLSEAFRLFCAEKRQDQQWVRATLCRAQVPTILPLEPTEG